MFEAYKIGVSISVINHASLGLAALSKDFLKTEAAATQLQARIVSIQKMALKGGLMLSLGGAGLALLKSPYEEAKKLAQAQADFKTMNLSAQDNTQAMAQAAALAQRNLGTTLTGNIKNIHDLHTAFGDLHHALRSSEDFSRFSFIARVMNGGKEVDGLVYNAAKALEHRGQKVMGSSATFSSELNDMVRVHLGSKGKVGPSEFFHASQTGKLAYTLMSQEELYGPFAAYMQAKTGTTAGTAAMTFASSLVGGHMTAKAKGFLAELGLWEEGISPARMRSISRALGGLEGKKLNEALHGMGILAPLTGGLKSDYLDLAVHNPSQLIQQIVVPAIRKRYGMDLSDEAVASLLMKHFNRNTSDFMGEYVVNAMKFSKDASIFSQSMGITEAYQHYLKTPVGSEIAASAAYRNFKAVFGRIFLPTITKGLLGLAKGLTALSDFFDKHKNIAKVIGFTFAALAGGLALRGTVLLLTAAFQGLGLAMRVGGLLGWAGRTAGGAAGGLGRYLFLKPLRTIGKSRSVRALSQGMGKFKRLIMSSMAGLGQHAMMGLRVIGQSRPVRALAQGLGGVLSGLVTPFKSLLKRFVMPIMTWIGRIVMIGLRGIPILGWVITIVTLGIWVLRNWDVVCQKARELWGGMSRYLVSAWHWVKEQTLSIWHSMKDALGGAFKAFAWWFLDQWQAFFNGLLSVANKILPQAWAFKELTFADDFRRRGYSEQFYQQHQPPASMSYPIQVQTNLHLDGRQIAQAVTVHQTQAAQRAAFSSGSQPDGSLYFYSPAQP